MNKNITIAAAGLRLLLLIVLAAVSGKPGSPAPVSSTPPVSSSTNQNTKTQTASDPAIQKEKSDLDSFQSEISASNQDQAVSQEIDQSLGETSDSTANAAL